MSHRLALLSPVIPDLATRWHPWPMSADHSTKLRLELGLPSVAGDILGEAVGALGTNSACQDR